MIRPYDKDHDIVGAILGPPKLSKNYGAPKVRESQEGPIMRIMT